MLEYLDEGRVRAALAWDPLIDAMERALGDFSAGKVLQPVRSVLTVEEGRRYLGVMPAVADEAMGLKLVSFYPANAETGVPTHHAMIVLMRPDTGEPMAAMDGTLITERRTAAVSAAVTRRLARPDAKILALVGGGVQAGAHLKALGRVRAFAEVRVWSRTFQQRRALRGRAWRARQAGRARGSGGRRRDRRGDKLADAGAARRLGEARRACQRGRRLPAKLARA
jgi:thiomorpholine-carboxylate dehydrogenase